MERVTHALIGAAAAIWPDIDFVAFPIVRERMAVFLGAKRISLMAPYMCALTDLVVKYIENEGIEVIDAISFEIPDNLEVGRRDPLQLLEDVKRLNTAGADVVVASACVQMPSLPAVQRIEDMLGIRTVSTAVCTTRRMLDHLGLEPVVPGAGALLEARAGGRL